MDISLEHDTILNLELYNKVNNDIRKCCEIINSTNLPSKQLNLMGSRFKYLKTFETKGVQGIVGLMTCNKLNIPYKEFEQMPVVFKLPIEIDKSVEHEHFIINDLNKLRPFCPHFVTTYGIYELPISRTFVYANAPEDTDDEGESVGSESDSRIGSRSERSEDEEEFEEYSAEDTRLFMEDKEYLPTNLLLLEYISKLSFADLCKKGEKQLINSQIIGVLAGLAISQKHLKFTHYDLHLDNVLIRECEKDAIFVYRINDYSFSLQTYGFYPVIIDMGSSYDKNVEGKTMNISVANYDKGLQSNMYDPLNDLHHFLISALYDVEYDNEEFYYLSTRLMYIFKNIKILRKKGWKILPNNILKLTQKHIEGVCSEIEVDIKTKENKNIKRGVKRRVSKKNGLLYGLESIPIWNELDRDIMELLSYGIKLPWVKELDEDLLKNINKEGTRVFQEEEKEMINDAIRYSFIPFIKEIEKLNEMDIYEDTNDLYFVLKEIIDLVSVNRDIINSKTSKQQYKKLMNDLKKRLIPTFRDSIHRLNWEVILLHCKYITSILGYLYYVYAEPHIEYINNAYINTSIKGPVDMIKFFKQNCTMRPVYNKNTVIYEWDANKETRRKINLVDKLGDEEIENLNKMTPKESEKIILSLM